MENFFTKKDYADAEMILEQLSVKTNCFNTCGQIIPAKYLVCVDDDITSAFYAADLYHKIDKEFGYRPQVLCVGGKGPLSKYTNSREESEGMKLRRTCVSLGVAATDIKVLDKGTNTGLNCLDIYLEVTKNFGFLIMCLTKRLSLRIKQTFEFLDHQYSDKVDTQTLDKLLKFTFYYVPEETLKSMMKLYNCKGLCKGVLLLSEIASIYDRVSRYSGKLQKPLDFVVTNEVVSASKYLAKKYPLKINVFCFNGVWQFAWVYLSLRWRKRDIIDDMWCSILNKGIVLNKHVYLKEKPIS